MSVHITCKCTNGVDFHIFLGDARLFSPTQDEFPKSCACMVQQRESKNNQHETPKIISEDDPKIS